MTKNSYNKCLCDIFKLKLLINKSNPLDFYPDFSYAQNLYAQDQNLFPKLTTDQTFSTLFMSDSLISKLLYYFISSYKLRYLQSNAEISRYSSLKLYSLDFRFDEPMLAEFLFLHDPEHTITKSTEKVKAPFNFFVNTFYANSQVFRSLFKRCRQKRLKHWQKFYGFLLTKSKAKHYSYMAYTSSFEFFLQKLFSTLLSTPFLNLERTYLHRTCFFNLDLFAFFNVFFSPDSALRHLLQFNGLVAVTTTPESINQNSFFDDFDNVFITPTFLTDYGFYYPFSLHETMAQGIEKPLDEKKIGSVTKYALYSRHMLRKKYVVPKTLTTDVSNRIFPNNFKPLTKIRADINVLGFLREDLFPIFKRIRK